MAMTKKNPVHADLGKPKLRIEEDCTTRRRTRPMPVFNPKKDKLSVTRLLSDKNNNTDTLIPAISMDVATPCRLT